jgi:hypothetical protein
MSNDSFGGNLWSSPKFEPEQEKPEPQQAEPVSQPEPEPQPEPAPQPEPVVDLKHAAKVMSRKTGKPFHVCLRELKDK